MVVGSNNADLGNGAVYVFTRRHTAWPEGNVLTLPLHLPYQAELGSSVAVDGGTVVAGAPAAGNGRGAAYVFTNL